jgi:hypothetical protein
MDCVSAYATDVGARSWEAKGVYETTLAKWAACPPSCMRVVHATRPDPIAAGSGSAREVKLVSAGVWAPVRGS